MKNNMPKKIVVTGMSAISPFGNDINTIAENLYSSKIFFSRLEDNFNASFPCKYGGMVKDFLFTEHFSDKIALQTDKGTQFALVAAKQLIENSSLKFEGDLQYRSGIILGNNLGGSGFGESQLIRLSQGGARAVSAYQSIAWFYPSALGQISIAFNIKGYSKTFIAERASSHAALYEAYWALQRGDLDLCIAGGFEAPFTPYSCAGYKQAGLLSTSIKPEYFPFSEKRNGLILGEGCSLLLLETFDHARKRGANILAELKSCSASFDIRKDEYPSYKQYGQAIKQGLKNAGVDKKEIGMILPETAGTQKGDLSEYLGLKEALGNIDEVNISFPKNRCGHLIGASGALDSLIAVIALNKDKIPPVYKKYITDKSFSLNIVSEEKTLNKENIIVIGRGLDSINVTLVFGKFKIS